MTHAYRPTPHSGAGNCECGDPERSKRHPHEFVKAQATIAAGSRTICTCGASLADDIHVWKADQTA